MTQLTVAIFSYNRGAYLKNCVDSVRRNLLFATVVVYDDASDDPATLGVLQDMNLSVSRAHTAAKSRHGGLYPNMARALADCATPLLLFLQEDMQIVRPVTEAEVATIAAIFVANPAYGFICPNFMKSTSLATFKSRMVPHPQLRVYGGRADDPKRIAYADVMIAHVSRLRAAGWTFGPSERAAEERARQLFADMPYLGDPFTFYCPEVPIFRNRMQSLSSRIAARLTGLDVKAFHDLDSVETQRMLARPLSVWPVAEEWLKTLNPMVRRPFVYKDVKVRRWLNLLNKVERLWRR